VTEKELTRSVIELAQLTGWRVAHFRPAQMANGEWRTAVQGDGKGFPDLVLAALTAVLFVELKVGKGKLSPEQKVWRDRLLAAGADWQLWTDADWAEGRILAALKGVN
jgi:hypothetical protein